jgi:sensor histidine kinase YesM
MKNPSSQRLQAVNWYWVLQVIGWSFVTLFLITASSRQLHRLDVLVNDVVAGAGGLLISDLWHRLVKGRRWAVGINWRMIAGPVLLLAPLQTAFLALVDWLLKHTFDSLSWLPMLLLFWAGVFLAWNISYVTFVAVRRANRFQQEALRLEVLSKDAELRALQAQVNPHFFFNSLNSVRALVFESPEAAAQMIDRLASLMRYALTAGMSETVPLREELEAVEAYLAIEKIRFEERLRPSIDIEDGLQELPIPPMSLQTLVENAVKYGVESSSSGSDIRIVARRDGGNIRIEVANTGAIRPFVDSTRVGLANARKRLALAVGKEASLDLSENSGWVRATLQLPVAA